MHRNTKFPQGVKPWRGFRCFRLQQRSSYHLWVLCERPILTLRSGRCFRLGFLVFLCCNSPTKQNTPRHHLTRLRSQRGIIGMGNRVPQNRENRAIESFRGNPSRGATTRVEMRFWNAMTDRLTIRRWRGAQRVRDGEMEIER